MRTFYMTDKGVSAMVVDAITANPSIAIDAIVGFALYHHEYGSLRRSKVTTSKVLGVDESGARLVFMRKLHNEQQTYPTPTLITAVEGKVHMLRDDTPEDLLFDPVFTVWVLDRITFHKDVELPDPLRS